MSVDAHHDRFSEDCRDLLLNHLALSPCEKCIECNLRVMTEGYPSFHEVDSDGGVLEIEAVIIGIVEQAHVVLGKVVVDITGDAFGEMEPVEVCLESRQVLLCRDVIVSWGSCQGFS